MKTNITLKLDADLLREARVLAAEEGRYQCAADGSARGDGPRAAGIRHGSTTRAREATARPRPAVTPARVTSSMSDKYFADTNILMYAHDRGAGAKHDNAEGADRNAVARSLRRCEYTDAAGARRQCAQQGSKAN